MNEQVAIKRLIDHFEVHDDGKAHPFLDEAVSMAINALKIVQKLKERKMTMEVLENYMQFEDECVKKGFTFKSILEAREKLAIDKRKEVMQEVAENDRWIPFTQREMTEGEKECCGTEEGYMLDCPLPDEEEEILVTYANGTVDVDVFMRDGNECYLDSGMDLVTEAIAWRRKPAPYQKGE